MPTSSPPRPLLDRAARTLFAAALFAAPYLTVSTFAWTEPMLAPVVRDVRLERTAWAPGGAWLWLSMTKVRDCRFLGARAYAGDPTDAEAPRERLRVRIENRKLGLDHDHPPGPIRRGPWRVGRPATDAGPSFFVVLWHRCHALYTNRSEHLVLPLEAVFDPPQP